MGACLCDNELNPYFGLNKMFGDDLSDNDVKGKADKALKSTFRQRGRFFIQLYAKRCLKNGKLEDGFHYICASVALELNIFNSQYHTYSQRTHDISSALMKGFPYKQGNLGTISKENIRLFRKYQKASGLDEESFLQAAKSHFLELHDQGDLLSPDVMTSVLQAELKNDINALTELYEQIEQVLTKELKQINAEKHSYMDEY